jgi:hypothetical protein
MLAMDVVDTLRHADKLVERELSADERDRQLKERLRQIYAAQGIDVPESILDEGVRNLREERFVYRPPRSGFRRTMALLWVRRRRWGKALAIVLAAAGVLSSVYWFGMKLPEERRIAEQATELNLSLPRELSSEVERIKAVSLVPEANKSAEAIAAQGLAAARSGDLSAARSKLVELKSLRSQLEQAYSIRIVSRPDVQTGFYRNPQVNPNTRNYYLVVEAIDGSGKLVEVPVVSEESGKRGLVSMWAARVNESTFNKVRADKLDDGIIQDNRFGEKRRGMLNPEYLYPTAGGAILAW